MDKIQLIQAIMNIPNSDVMLESVGAVLAGKPGNRDEVLTATEACQFLKISRSSLWRHFKPTMKIGSLPRWKKSALIGGAQ